MGITCRIFSQGFYDIEAINNITIIFPYSNWDYLLDSLVYAGSEERLPGMVFINGEQFDSVGVRYKGNSSYNPNRVKNPLNIKLDYIIGDQTIEGYGTLKLSNGFKDPSFIRETMGYVIARKYIPASLSNYAKVTINGQYIGLYTSNQDVDKFFKNTWFTGGDDTRFKGEINGNIPPGQYGVWKYYGTDSTSYFPVYTLESEYGWNDLIRFLDTLNNFPLRVENVLNLDRHLWFLAFENLLVNLDSPINNPQNYYLDKDNTARFNPVLWDLNETFGCFNDLSGSGQLNLYQLQHLDPFVHVPDFNFPVLNKILTNPLYKKMYVAHMKTMIEENFSNDWYVQRALEIRDIIDEEVLADPNKLYTYNDFLNNLYYTVSGGPPPGGMPMPGITELMETRKEFLGNLSMFQAQAPVITDVTYMPSVVTPNTVIWFNARVSNATSVRLGYCDNSMNCKFLKTQMLDDGNHHDGVAGDSIFGAGIIAGMTEIRYYILSENEYAASFSPVRAEFEFYSVPVTFELVINEFMADNETTVQDQDGEYDDWIEFYNKSNSAISLAGFNLTDKPDNIDKWTFPDTTIAAGGYLIVWSDEDSLQAGLHANFKLSASGEDIILSDAALNIVDEMTFGSQKTDTTTGRYPNGTGPFIIMWPTFNAENIYGFPTGTDDQVSVPSACLEQNSPNPFSFSTIISFYLPEAAPVKLEIRDIWDRTVCILNDGMLPGGKHIYKWQPALADPGIYLCLLITKTCVLQKKMIVVRD